MVEPAVAVEETLSQKPSTEPIGSDKPFPTEEEFATLPRVPGHIPWTSWTVAVVEFAERFSYYGTTAVCEFSLATLHPVFSISYTDTNTVVNFIQRPLPPGSTTGAGYLISMSTKSGALGMGQRASTGLVMCMYKQFVV